MNRLDKALRTAGSKAALSGFLSRWWKRQPYSATAKSGRYSDNCEECVLRSGA